MAKEITGENGGNRGRDWGGMAENSDEQWEGIAFQDFGGIAGKKKNLCLIRKI